MKNNRQIGLDGKVFISSCLKRGTLFVLMLMLYGVTTAIADILKLTGASGAVMGSFTTTLLVYDFIVSLALVVVVFYAYFLECGYSVPIVGHKPLVIFGLFRLGYYVLLSYYICYRALFCLTADSGVPKSLAFFYSLYFVLIILLILANCFIFNILTRNSIRRSYIRSFHLISTIGLIVQFLLPIAYIIARVTMRDVGDEYFTSSLCDMLRLCIAPIFLCGVWFLFIHSISHVQEVFNEVDTALRERRYQITYTTESLPEPKDQKRKKLPAATPPAHLPAAPKTPAISGGAKEEPKALPAAKNQESRKPASSGKKGSSKKPEGKAAPGKQDNAPASKKSGSAPVIAPLNSFDAAGVTEFETAESRAKAQAEAAQASAKGGYATTPVLPNGVPVIQDYDPFPGASVPSKKPTGSQPKGSAAPGPRGKGKSPSPANRPNQGTPKKNPGNHPTGNRPQQKNRTGGANKSGGASNSSKRAGHR